MRSGAIALIAVVLSSAALVVALGVGTVRETNGKPITHAVSAAGLSRCEPSGPQLRGGEELNAATADPVVLDRLARLESRVAGVERRFPILEAEVLKILGQVGNLAATRRSVPRSHLLQPDIPQLVHSLALSDTQVKDVSEALASALDELDVLDQTPNAEGKTLSTIMDDELGGGDVVTGGQVCAALAKVMEFDSSEVPGRNETYAMARQRIKREAQGRVRSILTEEQKRLWDAEGYDVAEFLKR